MLLQSILVLHTHAIFHVVSVIRLTLSNMEGLLYFF